MTTLPCAIYTRKSSEDGLEQGFNSLDAQREACEAYILSQKSQGWKLMGAFEDGGFSGGNTDRPGLKKLLTEIVARRVRVVVVYKVDRLTRSLADFAKLVELFDAHDVSFVSVTQAFNTTTSMGRLTLNVLLSFAQFEREVTGERIRDKIAASKKKGMWMGGIAPIGYLPHQRTLVIDEPNAEVIRKLFARYLELGSVYLLKCELDHLEWITPKRPRHGPGPNSSAGNKPFSKGHLYRILGNAIYIGRIVHKGASYPGQHPAIIDLDTWNAVQARLADNHQGHVTRSNARAPSLLAGLAFDALGNRLAPTHTKKGVTRYRYYIRQTDDKLPALRIPALELEDLVVNAMVAHAQERTRLMDQMHELDPDVDANSIAEQLKAAHQVGLQLREAGPERMGLIRKLVARITVGEDAVEITVRVSAFWDQVGENTFAITVPAQIKRCGMAMRLIIKAPNIREDRGPDPKLVNLLARAQRWFNQLSTGQASSVLTIANDEGLDSRDVTRVIYLAFLAPDIVQRIVKGEHSPELNAKTLLSLAPLPLDWAAQRQVLGFTA